MCFVEKKELKIALLTDGIMPFVTGGMQRHSANLAKYFTLAGIKVTLVHCVPFGASLPSIDEVNKSLFGEESDVQLNQIVTLHFPEPGKLPGHYILNSYKYARNIFSSLDWDKFDFVYAKGFAGWHYIDQKKKGLKLPPIGVKFHGYEMFQELPSLSQRLKAKLLQKPTRWNNQNADVVFSYGGKITDIITQSCKVPKEKIIEITSGIDNEWIRNSSIQTRGEKIKFVFVGRDEVRKGLSELNQVIKNIKSTDFEFHFIGPIPEEKQIKNSHIFYYGTLASKEAICEILDKMDVLVCPSHSEGMPNVILEGMSQGLAILATDVGAVEMLVSEDNGFLIPPLQPQKLEEKLLDFIEMPSEQLQILKNTSLQKVKETFQWESVIQQIIKKISNLEGV